MKPRWLAFVAALASLGFAYWLVDRPHTSRELFVAMVAWVLGFWVATGIRRAESRSDEGDWDEEGEDDWEDED